MFKKINSNNRSDYSRFAPIRESYYAFVISHNSNEHTFLRGGVHTSYLVSDLTISLDENQLSICIIIYTGGLLSC